MTPPTVLVVDDDADLRLAVGDVLREILGVFWVGAGSLDDLIALGDRALECRVAILDVNLGPDKPSGVDAFEWLKRQGFRGRIVFLTGHACADSLVARAAGEPATRVYKKPITLEELGNLIDGERS